MTKMIALGVVVIAFTAAAFAQTGAGPAVPAPSGSATGSPTGSPTGEAAAAVPASPAPAGAAEARQACIAALNADPKLEADILATLHDKDTLKVHNDAYLHVQKNERHVIYAYAAMWIVAAGFVIYLWRRQQGLLLEIAQLRRDLEAAGNDGKPAARS